MVDAKPAQELRVMSEDFVGGFAAVKVAEQTRDGLDDERIGVAAEATSSLAKLRRHPEPRKATWHSIGLKPLFGQEQRAFARPFDQPRQTVCHRR